jgi:hypothetical protein
MVMKESYSPMHMANNRKYEPQRSNHFEVEIADLPGGPDASRKVTLATNAFGLPNISSEPIEVHRGNANVKFSGKATFAGAESLECIDYIGLDVEMVLNNWQRMVYDPHTGKAGYAADYKRRARVTEFSPDGSEERSWILEGVWPSGIDYGASLTYEGAEVKKVIVAIAYDWGYREL